MKIAFIGLGNMGIEMAKNLLKEGHSLKVFNRTRSKCEQLKQLGANVASTPGEAVSDVEVMITMLSDDDALEGIIFAPGNILTSLQAGSIHLSMSTISVKLSRRLEQVHRAKLQHFISATVFGRPDAAAARKLFIAAAGPPEEVNFCKPLFDAMGQKTYFVGQEAHLANVVKLAGNFMITAAIESMAESFALIRKCGINEQEFYEFISKSLFSSPIYQNYGRLIAYDELDKASFRLALGFKDNRLVLAAAEDAAVPMPLASLVHDRFVEALANGLENADWAAIARISFQNAGINGIKSH